MNIIESKKTVEDSLDDLCKEAKFEDYKRIIDNTIEDDNYSYLVEIVKDILNEPWFEEFFAYYIIKGTDYKRKFVLSNLLSSEINIFTTWYTRALRACMECSGNSLRRVAENIYKLYKDQFDLIN